MTEDTKRALEVIKPLADELEIPVSADDDILYVGNVGIAITWNSTRATLMEFIGYVFLMRFDEEFREIDLTCEQFDTIQRTWIQPEALRKLKGGDA